MLNTIIRLSLTHRTLVLAGCVVVLVYGGYLSTTLPIDVFPDLDRPRVVILTECPGLSSEEVETLVTYPIETAVLGANGVEDVRSQSSQGMNVIYIEFGWQIEPRYARQIVSERLGERADAAGDSPGDDAASVDHGADPSRRHSSPHRAAGRRTSPAIGQTGLLAERTESRRRAGAHRLESASDAMTRVRGKQSTSRTPSGMQACRAERSPLTGTAGPTR